MKSANSQTPTLNPIQQPQAGDEAGGEPTPGKRGKSLQDFGQIPENDLRNSARAYSDFSRKKRCGKAASIKFVKFSVPAAATFVLRLVQR
jgi:hypothetical protein